MGSPGETFITVFDKACKENPCKECCVAYDVQLKRTSMTFKDMWALSCRYAYILKQHGLERGDYVVVTTPLSLEYMVASLGVILAGGSHISMEKFFSDCAMIRETLKMSKAKFMIVGEDNCETWDYFKGNAMDVCIDSMSANYKDEVHALNKILFTPKSRGSWKRGFLEHLRLCTNEFTDKGVTPQDGVISCASLNPGIATPKLPEYSHGGMVDMARKWTQNVDFKKTHFVYPFYLVVMFPFDIMHGRTRVISDFLETPCKDMTQHILDVVQAENLTTNLMSPTEITKAVDVVTSSPKYRLHLLKEVITGGMPMTNAFLERARHLSETIIISYVASENCLISLNRLEKGDHFTPFDSGLPLPGIQVRITNDKNQEVPEGQTGLIALKSDSLFLRYVGEPERTKSAWTEDGWYTTGDAGCLLSNGHLIVYGRQSEAISRGIVLTYPGWLEKPIASHPEVLEVTVVGVPDPINFRNTCACVVKRPGSQLTEARVHDFFESSLTDDGCDYFVLDHVIFFEDSLPKVPRDKLGEIAAQKLGLQYE